MQAARAVALDTPDEGESGLTTTLQRVAWVHVLRQQPLHSWGITSGDVVFAVPYKLEWRGLANYDAVADAPLDARSLGSVNLFVKNHQGSTRTLCVDLTKHTVRGGHRWHGCALVAAHWRVCTALYLQVHDVKRMMFSLEGIQPSMQRLYFGGRPLKPASLLMDAGVNRDSTLEMQVKLGLRDGGHVHQLHCSRVVCAVRTLRVTNVIHGPLGRVPHVAGSAGSWRHTLSFGATASM